MKQALFYSLKVWLTSILITPLVIVVLTKIIRHRTYDFDNVGSVLGFCALMIYLGFLASIPSYIVLLVSTSQVNRYQLAINSKKLMLTALGILFTVIPFYVVFHNDDDFLSRELVIWITSYSLVIVASIWFYKLKSERDNNAT